MAQATASESSTLRNVDPPDTTSKPSSTLDSENEKKTVNSVNSVRLSNDNGAEVEPPEQHVSEYPKGTSLAFVVVALALSIFLASLDMVGLVYPLL